MTVGFPLPLYLFISTRVGSVSQMGPSSVPKDSVGGSDMEGQPTTVFRVLEQVHRVPVGQSYLEVSPDVDDP